MKKALRYDDIALIPKLGIVDSRDDCSTEQSFLGRVFSLPVIPANMKCSIDFQKAEWCRDARNNIFYILHRFYPYEEIEKWISRCDAGFISISVGVQQRDFDFLSRLSKLDAFVDYITIDIAHGHCLAVKNIISFINELNWVHQKPKVIAGNITTGEATRDLIEWGADAIKVGIGQGHVCTTRLETGFGMPMFTAIQECAEQVTQFKRYTPIIADGGISQFGDAAKAIAAGADMVMSGSMFARCIDSPAETEKPGMLTGTYKRWYGSASEENKGQDKYVEGKCVFEETNYLTYEQLIRKWKEALRSAISYAGGTKLGALSHVSYNIV